MAKLWIVIAVASPGQSDSGQLRIREVYAYSLNQAWAYAEKHFDCFADVVHVYPA